MSAHEDSLMAGAVDVIKVYLFFCQPLLEEKHSLRLHGRRRSHDEVYAEMDGALSVSDHGAASLVISRHADQQGCWPVNRYEEALAGGRPL